MCRSGPRSTAVKNARASRWLAAALHRVNVDIVSIVAMGGHSRAETVKEGHVLCAVSGRLSERSMGAILNCMIRLTKAKFENIAGHQCCGTLRRLSYS